MMTHCPQVASGETLTSAGDVNHADGILTRTTAWMRQAYCGLHGHDRLLRFEKNRMSLQCVSCGHESPGWDLNHEAPRPTVLARGELRRSALRPQLVNVRRIA